MQRCYPSPEEKKGWFEQALRDRDWAVLRDGDNTGATYFQRLLESKRCCHCPPATDAMPYGIFQYAGTAWGQSCGLQARLSIHPQGLSTQDLAWLNSEWCSFREGDPREQQSTILAWERGEADSPSVSRHIYPSPSPSSCLSAW